MEPEGILLVDKASGCTSHDVVYLLRKKLNIKKIGHAGTLDPCATGLLILLIGKATKIAQNFLLLDKIYDVKLTLGKKTSTADRTGEVIEIKRVPYLDNHQIEKVLKGFTGKIQQIPPMISAKKVNGKKLYELARKKIEIERKPQAIEIYSIELKKIELPHVYFKVHCSKGTYIRTLCDDIGEKLGCGAYMEELKRLFCGNYSVAEAVLQDKIVSYSKSDIESRIIPLTQVVNRLNLG